MSKAKECAEYYKKLYEQKTEEMEERLNDSVNDKNVDKIDAIKFSCEMFRAYNQHNGFNADEYIEKFLSLIEILSER